MNTAETRPCPLPRRLAALLYDGLILVGLWMIAAAIVVLPAGHAIDVGTMWFQALLLGVAFGYFAFCWYRSGQTVGMRAWRITLVPCRGPLGLRSLVVRFLVGMVSAAALGLGFWWSLARSDRATWHDLASATRLVVPAPQPRRSRT